MTEHRPLHAVIATQLAHLCEIYVVEAGMTGSDATSYKLLGIGAEIEALCAVLGIGIVPHGRLTEVLAGLRQARDAHLDVDDVRIRPASLRVNALILNLGARREEVNVDGLRPLHEVLLRWLEHRVETFANAVVMHQDDKKFLVGAEIQACANALLQGVVPAAELAGAIAWLTRIERRMPKAENDVTVQAVTVALRSAHEDLVSRCLPAPATRAEA